MLSVKFAQKLCTAFGKSGWRVYFDGNIVVARPPASQMRHTLPLELQLLSGLRPGRYG